MRRTRFDDQDCPVARVADLFGDWWTPLVVREPYQEKPPRFEYRLTRKGEDAWSVVAAMWRYGSDWFFPDDGAPGELFDKTTGRTVYPIVIDQTTGLAIEREDTRIRPRGTNRKPMS